MQRIIALLFCLASMASGATYYVSTSGSDGSDGSEGSPWATIDHGVDNAAAGDTVKVAGGVYREIVKPAAGGDVGNPIVLWTDPTDRAVISGADPITGWTQCTQGDVPGNTNFANIYYADINWYPSKIYVDGNQVEIASSPNVGWWEVQGAPGDYELIDTMNLTGAEDAWVGADIHYWTNDGHHDFPQVTGYDAAAKKLTLDPYWIDKKDDPMEVGNIYRLQNHINLLDIPGEYCIDSTVTPGMFRVYLWTSGSEAPAGHTVVGNVRGYGIELRFIQNLVLHGFEIRFSTGHGIGALKEEQNIVIENCNIHNNFNTGIYLVEGAGDGRDFTIRNCVIHHNNTGINANNIENVNTDSCHIWLNELDGIKYSGSSNTNLRNSYVHDHCWTGHPDNLQYTNVDTFEIDNCVVLHASQCLMSAGCDNGTITNNLIGGSRARTLIATGADNNWTYTGNSLVISTSVSVSTAGGAVTLKNNLMSSVAAALIGIPTEAVPVADYNLYYRNEYGSGSLLNYAGGYYHSMADYQAAIGQEVNSVWEDPQFVNAPVNMHTTSFATFEKCTQSRLYLGDVDGLVVGDKVEIHFDKILRTVTAVNAGEKYIEFNPALENDLSVIQTVLNWKNATTAEKDFNLAAGSPGIGMGEGGVNVGASFDLKVMDAGDYDKDGLVDITGLPVGTSDIARPGAAVRPDDAATALTVFPHPVRGAAVITASGPVEIYDVDGQMVFHSMYAGANYHSPVHEWNGLDMAGHPVSNGTYYVRSGNTVKRIMVIK